MMDLHSELYACVWILFVNGASDVISLCSFRTRHACVLWRCSRRRDDRSRVELGIIVVLISKRVKRSGLRRKNDVGIWDAILMITSPCPKSAPPLPGTVTYLKEREHVSFFSKKSTTCRDDALRNRKYPEYDGVSGDDDSVTLRRRGDEELDARSRASCDFKIMHQQVFPNADSDSHSNDKSPCEVYPHDSADPSYPTPSSSLVPHLSCLRQCQCLVVCHHPSRVIEPHAVCACH